MVSFSLASQRRDRRAFAPVGEFFFSNHRGIRNNPHGGEVVYRKIIRGGWLLRLFFFVCGGGYGGAVLLVLESGRNLWDFWSC